MLFHVHPFMYKDFIQKYMVQPSVYVAFVQLLDFTQITSMGH